MNLSDYLLRYKKRTILIAFISLVSVFVLSVGFVGPIQHCKIINAKHSLNIARKSVQWYKDAKGTLPSCLVEISQYALENNIDIYRPDANSGILFKPGLHKERISVSKGNFSEHNILNDQGGFYYNQDTGEVKINLTQPLKNYFIIYISRNGEEIPSDW